MTNWSAERTIGPTRLFAQIALRSPIGTPAPRAAGATAALIARTRGKGATTWT